MEEVDQPAVLVLRADAPQEGPAADSRAGIVVAAPSRLIELRGMPQQLRRTAPVGGELLQVDAALAADVDRDRYLLQQLLKAVKQVSVVHGRTRVAEQLDLPAQRTLHVGLVEDQLIEMIFREFRKCLLDHLKE